MIISIINRSKKIGREEAQTVIRAISRQLMEDFKPYWHKEVILRLEGKASENPNPDSPLDMRGDAVIYLWDQEADVSDALGYHNLNYRGVPYGFVFTEISAQLGEPWSVTLSHEALELAVDPEVNLFASGPHPEDPSRQVLHWYEVCDAVQDETYEIDGVAVSNFLLPLYFTTGEEAEGHNDFLGKKYDGKQLESFGINPGGYVGFFDPLTGEHDTHTMREDRRAEDRMATKYKAKGARRALRYQGAPLVSYEDSLAFDALVFEVIEGNGRNAKDIAVQVVKDILGPDWQCKPVKNSPMEFDAIPPADKSVSVSEAWKFTYDMRRQQDISHVEPSFVVALRGISDDDVDDTTSTEISGRGAYQLGRKKHKPGTDKHEWSLTKIDAQRAWKVEPPPGGKRKGKGIRVGHPDSGYRHHPELDPEFNNRILTELSYDFCDEDPDPEDDSGNHGLGTASVIISGINRPEERDYVTGVAPEAELLPLRVTSPRLFIPAPVLLSAGMRRLRDAIHYAVDNECHVISISLGGLTSRGVHNAIQRAVKEGVIVLAAAGNRVRFVVWPAVYKDVIAVAACNIFDKPWSGSSRGKAVDVTAPGESVWKATINKAGPTVVREHGTSFAVATVAGVAALWLAHHGRENILKKYNGDKSKIVPAFKKVLTEHGCVPSDYLSPEKFGVGIVNALKVLEAELPTLEDIDRMSTSSVGQSRKGEDAIDVLASLFEDLTNDALSQALIDLLQTSNKEVPKILEHVGEEFAFHLMVNPQAYETFLAMANKRQQPKVLARRMSLPNDLKLVRTTLASSGLSSQLRKYLDKRADS